MEPCWPLTSKVFWFLRRGRSVSIQTSTAPAVELREEGAGVVDGDFLLLPVRLCWRSLMNVSVAR